jgi:hypothetical protein
LPTCDSSFQRAGFRFTISDTPSQRPIGLVAAQLFVRRWPLYALTCAVVFGIEILFMRLVHVKFAPLYAALIGVPLVNAIVTVNVGADATGALPSASARLERLLERTWAIIILDVTISIVAQVGFGSMLASDAGDILLGILVTFLAAMLVYAEPYAALESEVRTLTVVPFAIMRSMMLCWVNMPRIFKLFIVQIVVTIGQVELMRLPGTEAQADTIALAYITFTSAPLAALFAVAYLDTLAQERRTLQQ